VIRDFFLGFIRIHVLHHAAEQPVYGLSLIEELGRHGYTLSPGTLYPILRDLSQSGYLRQDKQVVGGRIRKYYTITTQGRRALVTARARIKELVAEVLGHGGPGSSVSSRSGRRAGGRHTGRPVKAARRR
jgi:DNA-binding PadR family transcriptional regulator